MSKFCRNCGEELNDNQSVCLKCGVSTQNNDEENNIVEDKVEKAASTGFILGLCSLVAWIIPLFGYPVTICGIIFSSKGLASKANKGKATAGLVLAIIFLIITLINSIAGVIINLSNL
jgi:uncharacterized membrane protein YvbJ